MSKRGISALGRTIRARGKRSILVSWGLSYLAILLVPLTFSVFSSQLTGRIVVNEISSAHTIVLDNFRNDVERNLNYLDHISRAVIHDLRFQDTLRKLPLEQDLLSASTSLMKLFAPHWASNERLSILLYLPQYRHLIAPETANSVQILHTTLTSMGNVELSLPVWEERLSRHASEAYSIEPYLGYSNAGLDSFVLQRSIMLNNVTATYANLFVSIPCDTLRALSDNTLFMISSPEDGMLWQWNPRGIATPPDPADLGDKKICRLNGEEYVVSGMASTDGAWIYTLLTPMQELSGQRELLARILLVLIIFSGLVGVALTLWFVSRHYSPISGLLSVLERFGGGHKNEYDAIHSAITTLSVENETIKSSLDQQREQIRESYLLTLLLGRDSHPAQNTVAYATREALTGRSLRIISIKLSEDCPAFAGPAGHNQRSIEIINYSINNVFCELLANRFDYYRLTDGDSVVYILTMPGGEGQADSELGDLLNILLDCFENELSVSLTIVAGKPVDRIELLSSAYKDVLELLEYSASSGGNGIFYVDETGDKTAPYIPGREYYDQQLARAVDQGDAETAVAAANALLDIILEQSSLNAPYSCHLLWHIPDIALKSLTNAAQPDSAFMTRVIGKMEALSKTRDKARFSAGVTDIVRDVCAYIQIQGIEQSGSVAARIAQYIDSNYADINLNINQIAGEFGMNPKTISRHFRQATSTGVLDYINKVRIGHAIRSASVQDIALEELSREVGYTNIKTFRRAFAKIVGTTPGKYFQKSRKRVVS